MQRFGLCAPDLCVRSVFAVMRALVPGVCSCGLSLFLLTVGA